jgi:hypothetical protein
LRELLFGDGTFSPGVVKGEERRAETTRILRRMREAFDAVVAEQPRAAATEEAEARIADLEEELRKIAAARSADSPDRGT